MNIHINMCVCEYIRIWWYTYSSQQWDLNVSRHERAVPRSDPHSRARDSVVRINWCCHARIPQRCGSAPLCWLLGASFGGLYSVYEYTCTYMFIFINMYVCVCVYIHSVWQLSLKMLVEPYCWLLGAFFAGLYNVCTCIYICIYMYMCVCVCVCIYTCVYGSVP